MHTSGKLETLHQVRDAINELLREVRRTENIRKLTRYGELLDRLEKAGLDVSQYRPDESFWFYSADGQVRLRGDEFVSVAIPALRFIDRRISEETALMAKESRLPADIEEERKRLLARLIDAYLVSPTVIHVLGYDGALHLHHEGIVGDNEVDLSHLRALHHDGLIILTPGRRNAEYEITIPTSTLKRLSVEEPQSVEASSGEERQERLIAGSVFNQVFNAPVGNIAQNSPISSLTVNQGSETGDWDRLITALKEAGLTDQGIEEITAALEDDEVGEGSEKLGPKVRDVLSRIALDASGQLAAQGALALPSVISALQSFVG